MSVFSADVAHVLPLNCNIAPSIRGGLALRSASRQLSQQPLTPATIRRRRNLARAPTPLGHSLILLAHLLADTTAARDRRDITVVAVNPHEIRSDTVDFDTVDNDIAWAAVVGAIAAGAVDFTNVDEGAAADCHCAAAVVLDDFVGGGLGAAAFPEDVAVA